MQVPAAAFLVGQPVTDRLALLGRQVVQDDVQLLPRPDPPCLPYPGRWPDTSRQNWLGLLIERQLVLRRVASLNTS